MNRISEIWGTKPNTDWSYGLKSTYTLDDIYVANKSVPFNEPVDTTAFYIKASGNNFFNGAFTATPTDNTYTYENHSAETYIGFGGMNFSLPNTQKLDTITQFNVKTLAKMPWIVNPNTPQDINKWYQKSYVTNHQFLFRGYDYTKTTVNASLLVTKTEYNPSTGKYDKFVVEARTIKECISITDKTNRYIVGIVINEPVVNEQSIAKPIYKYHIINATIQDMGIQLQTPTGNVLNPYDRELYYTTEISQYGGLTVINPDLIDFEHGFIGNTRYLPLKIEVDDLDGMCRLLASSGFITKCQVDNKHSVIYPVITSGMCDGSYTLDKDEFDKAENSKWTDTDIIPSPKQDTNPVDDVDNMQYKLYGTVGGNCRYYRITQSELSKFSVAIQSEEFVEPLKNIVCLNQYPFAVDPHIFNAYSDEDIKIQGKSTGATGRPVTNYIQSWGVDSIDVPNLHNNFLDNAPYTQYELYIPFCGWVQLPDFVHGHTLTVTLLNDIITTSVRGIVQCNLNDNNITVAEKQGVFGTSCPLSASDEGSKQNALTSAMFNTLGGLASTGFALSTGNAVGTVGGLMSTLSAITQGNIANNNNYVSSVGASSDRTVFANYDKIYLKINTVYSNEPSDYNHTYGRPCNKSGKVSDFTGYTTCSHFDTTGLTCSETEKQMIKNLFETGVYL